MREFEICSSHCRTVSYTARTARQCTRRTAEHAFCVRCRTHLDTTWQTAAVSEQERSVEQRLDDTTSTNKERLLEKRRVG